MIFKIYGERNSGTTFLEKLIQSNFGNVFVQKLYNNGYTPNDILLNFGTFIFEKNQISESNKMKYYSIISQYYSKVNTGYDTYLQLIGCVGLLNF